MNRVVVSISLLLSLIISPIAKAEAESVENCRIKASTSQTVSLGFPISPERLAYLSKPRILVIPFSLKDNPNYTFTSNYKRNYEYAASYIELLSKGKSSPQFVFLPPIATDFTNDTINRLRAKQNIGNSTKDESISTWGFVRKFIADHDSTIDFSGVSGVILEGSSTSKISFIAEAMTMKAESLDSYLRPIETNEGKIYNFVLMDKHQGNATIAHEVMHLYGLTDLYGSSASPEYLSLMSGDEVALLSYEKWVLGWLPDSEVQCLDTLSNQSITQITFNYSKPEQLFIIKTSGDTHYIIETSKLQGMKKLVFYSLNNELRPPIEMFSSKNFTASMGLNVNDFNAIGTQISSPIHTLLISDINESTLTLNLVPKSFVKSAEFDNLVKQADELKLIYRTQIEETARVESTVKKKSITCIKGKLTKKVNAINPKCPAGYKKK